jgi:uncharacterized protein with PhoU and TrkA domain
LSDKETLEKLTNQLVELKNSSELAMDLAYSSLLFNSPFIAEEVQLLYKRVCDLNLEFENILLSCQLRLEESSSLVGLIRMGMASERITRAASIIAQVVLRGIEPHPVLRMMIRSADETVERFTVSENSSLIGKTLKNAQLPEEIGWWLLVIKRDDKWVRPKASTILQVNDILIASGYADSIDAFKNLVIGQ